MRNKQEKRHKRHKRVRAKASGTIERPRFSVFRSNQHIYGQLIDDKKGNTLVSANDLELKKVKSQKSKVKIASQNLKINKEKEKSKIDLAYQVGKLIAEKTLKKGIRKVIFDRGGYKYHGRVKALADGAREGGLEF